VGRGPVQGCQGLSQTGRPCWSDLLWLELRVFPLDGTLRGSDNSSWLSNILILRNTCSVRNPIQPARAPDTDDD
jgi:hypothetical protein